MRRFVLRHPALFVREDSPVASQIVVVLNNNKQASCLSCFLSPTGFSAHKGNMWKRLTFVEFTLRFGIMCYLAIHRSINRGRATSLALPWRLSSGLPIGTLIEWRRRRRLNCAGLPRRADEPTSRRAHLGRSGATKRRHSRPDK